METTHCGVDSVGGPPFGVGDWLRFYRNGGLVIGQVEYIERSYSGYWHAKTDVGDVRADAVLERRAARPAFATALPE